MALILSLKEGDDFYVGDDQLIVSSVSNNGTCTIHRGQGVGGYTIGTDWKAVAQGVRLSATLASKDLVGSIRVRIDAPGKPIVRGPSYRRAKKGPDCKSCGGAGKLFQKLKCPSCNGFGCSSCVGGFIKESFVCPDC